MLVASDLNGTLTTGSPILAIARWVKENQPDNYPAGFTLGLFISYVQVRLGWKKIDAWGDINMRRALELVQSPSPEIMEEVMNAVVEEELWRKRREVPVNLLKDYHKSGAEIIIISAAFEPAVQKFASKIGAGNTYGIGTPIVLTPSGIKLDKTLTSRDIKLKKLRERIGSHHLDVALGDTFADIPLLEEAGEAIAVYPDKTLRQTALERGWKIIE
jgi:phosphoserine phosphatase